METTSPLDVDSLGAREAAPVTFVGFGPRLGAAVLDFLITIPLMLATTYFTLLAPSWEGFVAVVILAYLYKPVFESTTRATPGKMILKLRVVRAGDEKITFLQAFLRSIPWLIVTAVNLYFNYEIFSIPGYTEAEGWRQSMQIVAEYQMEKQQGGFSIASIIPSVVGLLPLISALVMLGNPRKQAAHDILAETFVVTDPKPTI